MHSVFDDEYSQAGSDIGKTEVKQSMLSICDQNVGHDIDLVAIRDFTTDMKQKLMNFRWYQNLCKWQRIFLSANK